MTYGAVLDLGPASLRCETAYYGSGERSGITALYYCMTHSGTSEQRKVKGFICDGGMLS
jgi:hypothetical protein